MKRKRRLGLRLADLRFFEAVPARNFQDYVDQVLMLNGSWSYEFDKVNLYKSPFYGSTTSMFMHEELEWLVVAGAPMSSPETGCVFIDNPRLSMRTCG